MSEITENAGLFVSDGKIKRKKTTTCLYNDVLAGLHAIKIVERESPNSIIQRLLEEHDIKTMRRVVAKRVR